MRGDNIQIRWQEARGKKRAHWGILTWDDLPKTNGKYFELIAQLKARYQAAKELGSDLPRQKLEGFTI
jgi:uncharacterized protein YjbJ (UPF0337 family)